MLKKNISRKIVKGYNVAASLILLLWWISCMVYLGEGCCNRVLSLFYSIFDGPAQNFLVLHFLMRFIKRQELYFPRLYFGIFFIFSAMNSFYFDPSHWGEFKRIPTNRTRCDASSLRVKKKTQQIVTVYFKIFFKGTVSRDFRPLVF
jgi:hypothetical protein